MAAMAAILDFRQNDFSYFDLLTSPMLPIKFQHKWPFVSGEEAKNRFSRWQSWRPFWNSFSYFFIYKSPPMLPTKFQVNWPFVLGEEANNRFSRFWQSWIADRNDFSTFCSTPRCFLPSFKSMGLSVQWKKRKIDFQDGRHSDHFGFPITTILTFLSTNHPDASYQAPSQLAFWFRRRSEK